MSQSQIAIEQLSGRPLTTLSEDEQMFRASVREFAEGELRPRVEQMDEHQKLLKFEIFRIWNDLIFRKSRRFFC